MKSELSLFGAKNGVFLEQRDGRLPAVFGGPPCVAQEPWKVIFSVRLRPRGEHSRVFRTFTHKRLSLEVYAAFLEENDGDPRAQDCAPR